MVFKKYDVGFRVEEGIRLGLGSICFSVYVFYLLEKLSYGFGVEGF